MQVESVIEPTGVKFLHHRAQQADLGMRLSLIARSLF